MKVKIFQNLYNTPKETEARIQEWLDSVTKDGQDIVIEDVSHIAVDGNLVQTMFIYRLATK